MPRPSKAIGTVLVLAERRNSKLTDHLRSCGYEVLETFTTDHAVAVAVNNPVDIVVLDQDCFIETDGWNVAQSLKVAKPGICVLLTTRAQRISKRTPKGVDAIVSAGEPDAILKDVKRLSLNSGNSGTHSDNSLAASALRAGRRKHPR